MSARKPPTAHTWADGGGMVVRCDDPEVARPLMVGAWHENACLEPEDFDSPAEYQQAVADLFPLGLARVERGRMLGALPNSAAAAEGWAWSWYPDDRVRRGTTVAVVWSEDR